MNDNNTNITAPAFERPRNPFALKEFLGYTHNDDGIIESAQFDSEDWYPQSFVDALRKEHMKTTKDLADSQRLESYYRDERNKEAANVRLMAHVINEYLEENCDDEDIVASFETLYDKGVGVHDPRRKRFEIEVVVTLKKTYRLEVECPQNKFDDMVDHIGDLFEDGEIPSSYHIENEWLGVIDAPCEYDTEVEDVEVTEA